MDDAVLLRPVREDDLPTLERMYVDPQTTRPFEWRGFRSPVALRKAFDEDGFLGDDRGRLVVALADGTLAGTVSWSAQMHGPNAGSRCFNVGMALLPEHRGVGVGTAAGRALAAYLFDTTTVQRLEAGTDVDNVAAQRVLDKAGFTREGILRGAQFRAGTWHDLVLYSRLRTDG